MVVRTENSPFLVNFVIGFLAVIALLPLASMIMMVVMGNPPKFGLFIAVAIFWFLSFRMARQFLWNRYGNEVLIFEKDRLTYFADFKYFQDSHQVLSTNEVNITVKEIQEWDENMGKLVFTSPTGEIELAVNVPVEDAYAAQCTCQEMIKNEFKIRCD